MDNSSVGDIVDTQIKTQGLSAIRTADGTVFTFPLEMIERLLERARVVGFVTVMVKHQVQS